MDCSTERDNVELVSSCKIMLNYLCSEPRGKTQIQAYLYIYNENGFTAHIQNKSTGFFFKLLFSIEGKYSCFSVTIIWTLLSLID